MRWEDAFTHATQALATPGIDETSTATTRASLWAGFASVVMGQPDLALEYATRCLDAAEKRRDKT
jgi:hypothetical protein